MADNTGKVKNFEIFGEIIALLRPQKSPVQQPNKEIIHADKSKSSVSTL